MFIRVCLVSSFEHKKVNLTAPDYQVYLAIKESITEEGIATELLNLGVPKEDIVLAFYPPQERKFTEFATA